MKKSHLHVFVTLLLIFVGSLAYSQSLLDKLKQEAEELLETTDTSTKTSTPQAVPDEKTQYQPVTTDLPEANRPIVLAIDGIERYSSASGGLAKSWKRVDSYLTPAVQNWGIASDVEHVMWNGDFASTKEYIEPIKAHIEVLSRRAKKEGREFIVVGHSWGSVLATRAISELGKQRANGGYSGNTEPLVVDQFVTMGSPLSAQDPIVRDIARKYTKGTGPRAASPFITSWKNYWLESDNISGSISAASSNRKMTEVDWLGKAPTVSHDSYYENADLWKYIGADVTVEIIKNARAADNTGETNSIAAPIERNEKNSSQLANVDSKYPDLYGIQIGMPSFQVLSVLKGRYPNARIEFTGEPRIRKSSHAYSINLEETGLISLQTNVLCSNSETWRCGKFMQFLIEFSRSEKHVLNIELGMQFPDRGYSVVNRINFSHDVPNEKRFDPLAFMAKKYGEQDAAFQRKSTGGATSTTENRSRNRTRTDAPATEKLRKPKVKSGEALRWWAVASSGLGDVAIRYWVEGRRYTIDFTLDREVGEEWQAKWAEAGREEYRQKIADKPEAENPF